MRLEVTSVSKKERPLGTSPAAVFVLTNEDIRRSGLTQHARAAPAGARPARRPHRRHRSGRCRRAASTAASPTSCSCWSTAAPSIRRSSPASIWDEVDVPLEDIERIEVIRGPGATMWGANAVNGVINVITQSADDDAGRASSPSTPAPRSAWLRASATAAPSATASRGAPGARPSTASRWPAPTAAGATTAGAWAAAASAPTIAPRDADELTLQGDLHDGREDQTSARAHADAALPAALRRARRRRAARNVVGRWTRTHSPQPETQPAGVRRPHQPRASPCSITRRTTLDVDFQHRQALGARHDLVWGLGYRHGRLDAQQQRAGPLRRRRSPRAGWPARSPRTRSRIVPERLRLDARHEGRAQRLHRRRAAAERARAVGGLRAATRSGRRSRAACARRRCSRTAPTSMSPRRPVRRACRP